MEISNRYVILLIEKTLKHACKDTDKILSCAIDDWYWNFSPVERNLVYDKFEGAAIGHPLVFIGRARFNPNSQYLITTERATFKAFLHKGVYYSRIDRPVNPAFIKKVQKVEL
jgi:hypothetical protein